MDVVKNQIYLLYGYSDESCKFVEKEMSVLSDY